MTVLTTVRKKIALVTGCGQGLGQEVAHKLAKRQCIVIATYRKLQQFTVSHSGMYHVEMDVTNEEQVHKVVSDVMSQFKAIDILVNNAGVYLDREEHPGLNFLPLTLFHATLDVNLLGAARTMSQVVPFMIRQGSGVIVNVSSGMGRNVELAADAVYYRTSKAALTALSRCAAQRLKGHGIIVNAVCPGWVRTRMGGDRAVRSVDQGAEGIVAAALEPNKSGVLLRDSEDFGW